MAARSKADLATTLVDFSLRIREELDYNQTKGDGPYRQGMHDGMRFAEEALVAILEECGGDLSLPDAPTERGRLDIAPEYFGANFWRERETERP
jgi:hypothetical protein